MKITNLRFYQTYDKNGVDSEIELQYQTDDNEDWETVPFVRVREVKVDDDGGAE